MGKLVNRAKMAVSGTPGTGAITLNAAVTGFQTFAAAGVNNGDVVSYVIEDGSNYEFGWGTYSSTGPALARTTILGSSNSGSAINATSAALVYCSIFSQDIANRTPWTNVKTDYGARGDGATDDTTAINNAIAAANSSAATIYFPPGTYKITSALNAITANGVRVVGDGQYVTTIAAAFTSGNTFTLQSQFSVLEGISFIPSVFKTSGYEIVISGGYQNELNDVYVSGGANGIGIISSTSIILNNINLRYLTGVYGIYFGGTSTTGSYGMWIKNVTADNPPPVSATAFSAWANSKAFTVGQLTDVNGWVWQCTTAGTTASSGTPAAPTTVGWWNSGSSVTSGTAVFQPVCSDALTWCFMDSYAYSLTGVDCAFIDGAYGLQIVDSANTGSSYPQWAYFFDLEVDHPCYTGIQCSGGLGLYVEGSWVGSSIDGNGFSFTSPWKGEATIENTRIVGNANYGVLANIATDLKITNCRIANNSIVSSATYHGVYIANSQTRFELIGNSTGYIVPFTSTNQGYGIFIGTSCDYYIFACNRGYGNVTGSSSNGSSGATHAQIGLNV